MRPNARAAATRLPPRPGDSVANRLLFVRSCSQSCAVFLPAQGGLAHSFALFLPSGGGGNRTRARFRPSQGSCLEPGSFLRDRFVRDVDRLLAGLAPCLEFDYPLQELLMRGGVFGLITQQKLAGGVRRKPPVAEDRDQ